MLMRQLSGNRHFHPGPQVILLVLPHRGPFFIIQGDVAVPGHDAVHAHEFQQHPAFLGDEQIQFFFGLAALGHRSPVHAAVSSIQDHIRLIADGAGDLLVLIFLPYPDSYKGTGSKSQKGQKNKKGFGIEF